MTKWSWKPILLGLSLRIVIFAALPRVASILGHQIECSTPISSFKRLQEGLFLYKSDRASPYDQGGICHQSPLLLALFTAVGPNQLLIDIVYSFTDLFIALCLTGIAEHVHTKVGTGKLGTSNYVPSMAGTFYLLNPFTLLSSLARSTSVFTTAIVVASLYASTSLKKPYFAIAMLALGSCLSFYPAYLLPATILLCRESSSRGTFKTQTIKLGVYYVVSVLTILALGFLVSGTWTYIDATLGTTLVFKDLTPNIGLWWYLITEMFEFFVPFFIGVLQIFLFSFTLPITIKFRKDPLIAVTVLVGLATLFKSYPEAGDIGFYLSLLVLNYHIIPLLQYSLVVSIALLYSAILGPAFYYLWIYLGSGNANFFYAITLVYALAMTLQISDTIWSSIRYDYDGGKTIALVQV